MAGYESSARLKKYACHRELLGKINFYTQGILLKTIFPTIGLLFSGKKSNSRGKPALHKHHAFEFIR